MVNASNTDCCIVNWVFTNIHYEACHSRVDLWETNMLFKLMKTYLKLNHTLKYQSIYTSDT